MVTYYELKKLDWAAADIPIVNKLVMDKIIQILIPVYKLAT
jgi:hypothetical protein